MSKEVERYSPDTNGRMREWPDGDYVSWDDYDALRTELAEANADFVRIANEREALLAERDRLKQLLAETRTSMIEAIHWEDSTPVRKRIETALQGEQP